MVCGRWLTLGNQLGPADQIYEEDLAARIKAKWVLFLSFFQWSIQVYIS
jgi:hypothetical protein